MKPLNNPATPEHTLVSANSCVRSSVMTAAIQHQYSQQPSKIKQLSCVSMHAISRICDLYAIRVLFFSCFKRNKQVTGMESACNAIKLIICGSAFNKLLGSCQNGCPSSCHCLRVALL